MPSRRVTILIVASVLIVSVALWTTVATSSSALTIDFGSYCFNMMSANGKGWITEDAIPAHWTGPVAGEFVSRFNSGEFSADGIELSYSKTNAAGPCHARTLN